MKLIKVSDDIHAALSVYATMHHRTIGAQLAAMLEADAGLTEVHYSLKRNTGETASLVRADGMVSLRDLRKA